MHCSRKITGGSARSRIRLAEFWSAVVASSTTLLRKVQAVIDNASIGRRASMSAFDIWPITEPNTATTIAI
ncbi:hypothetical protein ABIF93_003511 [Bradyrhizobium japonicum]